MIIKPSRAALLSIISLLLLAIAFGSLHALDVAVPTSLDTMLITLVLGFTVLTLWDAWCAFQQPLATCQRVLTQTLSLGQHSEVTLNFSHSYRRSLCLEYVDHLPGSFQLESRPNKVKLQPGHSSHTRYRIKPLQRGNFVITGCAVRIPSPLGLWSVQYFLAEVSHVRVYPDFNRIQSGQLQASTHWLSQFGVQQQQRRGSGLEFQQLREFRSDDSIKHIDWKASARKRTLISREYQDERDQQVIFLLDCGRNMRSQDGVLSHLDHALNACLLLAYNALRQGDAVGLQTFAGPKRVIAPAKGPAQMSTLLNRLYDIQASQDSADFIAMAQQLLLTQKRRALVIVISSLKEETDTDLILAMQQLKKHHRTLLVSLREEVLDQLREQSVQTYAQALLYCGGIDSLQGRYNSQLKLTQQGLDLLDVRPSQLTTQLLSQYMAIKKSGHY